MRTMNLPVREASLNNRLAESMPVFCPMVCLLMTDGTERETKKNNGHLCQDREQEEIRVLIINLYQGPYTSDINSHISC